ncbi:MAG: HAD family hydrolase [Deltaproteobacteria bacterium]|nr:HAD family hydrolase [Deltaproteobacteria bacterium]
MALLLFDVDGTLMRTHKTAVACFTQAGRKTWHESFSLEKVAVPGNTDPLILQEALSHLEAQGVSVLAKGKKDDAQELFFWKTYFELLDAALRGGACEALAGAQNLVKACVADPAHTTGLLTGNVARAGHLKLETLGFSMEDFKITSFGDEGASRADLVEVARKKDELLAGHRRPACDVVIIGDTPRDVACAHAHQCRAIAVCTGHHDKETLRKAGADAVLPNLEDAAAFFATVATVTA